jgi:hypothetical protein
LYAICSDDTQKRRSRRRIVRLPLPRLCPLWVKSGSRTLPCPMSAPAPKANIRITQRHVCFGPLSDSCIAAICADAVGTLITERPPHKAVQAAFPHTAPLTSQRALLISTTTTKVETGSNAVRLRLRSLTWATGQPPSVRVDDEGAMTSAVRPIASPTLGV